MNYFIYSNPHKIRIPLRLLDEILDYMHQSVWFLLDINSAEPVETYSNILEKTIVSTNQSKSTNDKFREHYFDATIKINEQLQQMRKTQEFINFTSKLYFYKERQTGSWWNSVEKIPYLLISLRFEIIRDDRNFKPPRLENLLHDLSQFLIKNVGAFPIAPALNNFASYEKLTSSTIYDKSGTETKKTELMFYFEMELNEPSTPNATFIRSLFDSIPSLKL